jgi:hypothetical protein
MQFSLKEFKAITHDLHAFQKHISDGNVSIDYSYGEGNHPKYFLHYSKLIFETVEDMFQACKYISIPYSGLVYKKSNEHSAFWKKIQHIGISDKATLQHISKDHSQNFKSIKLIPDSLEEKHQPFLIYTDPVEITAGDFTYRFLSGAKSKMNSPKIRLIARQDEPIYDYLDKGYFVFPVERRSKTTGKVTRSYVVSNEYNVHVAHIMMMCASQPALISELKDGCFVNAYEAEMTRLKIEKKLADTNRKNYNTDKAQVDNDYRKNTTLIVISKLLNGEIPKTTIRDITFTKTSVTYENISIEAPDLLSALYEQLDFNSEFDIYTISEIYSNLVQKKLDESPAALTIPEFKINGASIVATVTATFQRYINKIRINKDEIAKVIHRASCYHNHEDYTLFLKSVTRMSIRWHDIIANGLQVKIHQMNHDEMKDPNPSPSAPAIKLFIDPEDKHIKIKVEDDRSVRVSLSKLIKKVDSLNRKTNGGYSYGNMRNQYRYTTRNGEWCAKELIMALIECCTFTVKSKDENGEVRETQKVEITKDDITKLLSVAQKMKMAAIERSKEFLNTAIKLTGAKEVEFMGKKAYHIKGSLREYAVIVENAKVYDYTTKQYRCIVNDRHYKGAGYDDIASRLLALKNDSVMQNHINTLKGVTAIRLIAWH